MAKIKLATPERMFIPDVETPTDGGFINNRDNDDQDQVKCEITLATLGQKSAYIDSYSVTGKSKKTDVKTKTAMHFNSCITKHCTKITGLEHEKITDGKSLCEHDPDPFLNDLMMEIFLKVNGVHPDDDKAGSDSGDFTEGE